MYVYVYWLTQPLGLMGAHHLGGNYGRASAFILWTARYNTRTKGGQEQKTPKATMVQASQLTTWYVAGTWLQAVNVM